MLLTPVAPGSHPKIYFDVAEIFRRRWLEESGQMFQNVFQTHLVLASGKLLLQKRMRTSFSQTSHLHPCSPVDCAARTFTFKYGPA